MEANIVNGRELVKTVKKIRYKKAFSLLEIILTVSILAVLLSFAIINIAKIYRNSKQNTSMENMDSIRDTIFDFYKDHGRYPESLSELTTISPYPYFENIPVDPLTGLADWEVKKKDAGMLLYYKFSENSGTTAKDWSGNNQIPGTLRNGANWSADAISDYSVSLDGNNDYVYIDDTGSNSSPIFDATVDIRSVSMWYKANNIVNRQVLYEEGGGVNGLNIYINAGSVYVGAWSESDSWNGVWLSTATTAGTWHQVAYVFDFANGLFQLFYDGALISNSVPPSHVSGHGGNDAIGAMNGGSKMETGDQGGSGLYFNGIIDDFRVYDRALSTKEVAHIYDNTEDGLGGWWERYPESSGDVILDIRSNDTDYQEY